MMCHMWTFVYRLLLVVCLTPRKETNEIRNQCDACDICGSVGFYRYSELHQHHLVHLSSWSIEAIGPPGEASAGASLIEDWQSAWDESTFGALTHRLIPKLEPWLSKKHGELDFRFKLTLSGLGSFGKYLHRFHLQHPPNCRYSNVEGGPLEHTVFVGPCLGYGEKPVLRSGRFCDPDTIIPQWEGMGQDCVYGPGHYAQKIKKIKE